MGSDHEMGFHGAAPSGTVWIMTFLPFFYTLELFIVSWTMKMTPMSFPERSDGNLRRRLREEAGEERS